MNEKAAKELKPKCEKVRGAYEGYFNCVASTVQGESGMKNSNNLSAKARRDGLVTRELENETLIYDLTRNKAHCLNETAALIWKNCDGRTTVPEMSEFLGKELKVSVDEKLVWLALDKLGKAHLLEARISLPNEAGRISRREAVRRLGLGAALAMPVVMSIVAPTAASAATCIGNGQPANCNMNEASSACCSMCCNLTPTPDVCLQVGLSNGMSCVRDCQCVSDNCMSGVCQSSDD